MDFLLPSYFVNDATWFYLSFLLIVALFFRFNRLWSLRNLDLGLLLALAPALLFLRAEGSAVLGYVWLFVATGLLLVRVLCDPFFARRPKLPQNMNTAGLAFLCGAAGLFLTTKVITEPPLDSTVSETRRAKQALDSGAAAAPDGAEAAGPSFSLFQWAVTAAESRTAPHAGTAATRALRSEQVVACTMAILAHLAVVIGLIVLGHRHFGDLPAGVAMATLYLLLPCTAFDVGRVNHVLPAALIVWALVTYRHAYATGCLLGLACGAMFFPVFMLPVWAAFYGRRGMWRFGLGLTTSCVVVLGAYALISNDGLAAARQIIGQVNWSRLMFEGNATAGFWGLYPGVYRIPAFALFVVLLVALTCWPLQKNLADLIASSAALVIGSQFWYPQQGGVYILWYLPLLLMVVFRPQLQNHMPPDSLVLLGRGHPQSLPATASTNFTLASLFR